MKRDQNTLFSSLVESALEFLNKALSEFEESPKFSTVHFAIAVELFLKARLMKEHWSLLVEKTDSADKNAFFSGKAKTINPQTAIQRLAKIAQDPVPEDARLAFQAIAEHRNRMVHFVHDGINRDGDGPQSELEEVVAEQCWGWRQLQLLLEKNWKHHFVDFQSEIGSIDDKMHKHREYLAAKFKSKSSEIAAHSTSGGAVRTCTGCSFDAALVTHVEGAISSAACLVCPTKTTVIALECPTWKCHQKIEFDDYHGPPVYCPSCKEPRDEWVAEALDTDPVTTDNYVDHTPINCPFCSGYHTVVQHHEIYICTSCYEFSRSMGICGWCNEGQLDGVPKFSMVSGCEFCDGRAGWDKD